MAAQDEVIQLLCFRSGGIRFAVNVMHTIEILRLDSSGGGAWGTFGKKSLSYHGEELPLCFAADFVAAAGNHDLKGNRAIVMESGGRKCALVVDTAEEIMRISPSQIKSSEEESDSPDSQVIDGRVSIDEVPIYVLNAEKVLLSSKVR